ncbi:abnormal spindle-like microcephaly-associated protein [Ochotona curzoniae]|uniref:abnormal spindle-like microcephaly-associated protein n=1 Tax=Ochotona curzoniae TaxID=130825 RepID=UPI001B34E2CE|nr:abnormal spindle-like microcephaly-associated protein [Ochotona curzoniae]
MAARRVGRGCWEVSPGERRPLARRRGPAAERDEEEAASPPLLSLSHFCRSPFLCFGDVRVGSSCTRPLALDNPNAEEAEVKVWHLPAAELGFSVSPSHFVLQVRRCGKEHGRAWAGSGGPAGKAWTGSGGPRTGRPSEGSGGPRREGLGGFWGTRREGLGGFWGTRREGLDGFWGTPHGRPSESSGGRFTPKEKIVISVNWTPLKEGRVREIVTFLVNNIVKHQAILLGNAEEKKKKKRRVWNTISKKKISASSGSYKRISNTQNVNRTFSVPQNIDRVRSPLQACENWTVSDACSRTENNSLTLEENEIPLSPISPAFKECHGEACVPLSVRRSTAYSSLHASENVQLLNVEDANISKDFSFSEKVITETCFNVININSQSENSELLLTPNHSSTLNITQNHGHFLSPDSFVNNNLAANNGKLEAETYLSSDGFMRGDSKPVHLESKTVHEIYRTILSPDSFINDNYGINEEVESESVHPILSPNQFIKDNMAYVRVSQQTCEVSLSSENPRVSESPGKCRKSEALLRTPACQGLKSSKAVLEEIKVMEMKSKHYSVRKSHPTFPAVPDVSSFSNNTEPKRRPILSATVTKTRPTHGRGNQTEMIKPKVKRSLNSAVNEKIIDNQRDKAVLHSFLPIIDPIISKSKGDKSEIIPSSTPSLVSRKRKSEGIVEGGNVTVAVIEHTEVRESKRIHFSPLESKTSTAKKPKSTVTPISKYISNREKLNLKKKTDSVFRTPKAKRRTKPIVAVAQSSLTFLKPQKTEIPRHPLPFAAKNMFYDERWKEKQEQGFTWWLNFILTPDDFTVKTNVSEVDAATLLLGVENQHKISVLRAPTKDEVSLRAYTARCRLNRLRRAACRLFTSDKMVKGIKKLETEIEARRLLVRKDRHLWKDVGERQKVLNWLLSYNPLWLRIGLETIYGELISLQDNSDVTGLAMFILKRLLWNPDIAAEYRHPTVPHLYRDDHEEALSKFTLKKLLLLVCFLDYAKLSRLIDHDPCLFCKDAEFKASKEILLAFSRDFLSGEGDLSRHLSLLGLPVSHVQTPFDEFDFAVTNLAVDLQCGVRLVRTMELLTKNWELSKKLRIPAISRLQKIHNVDIALQVLKSQGIQLSDEHGNTILSKDIVDRHREKTLALLWKIAFAFQVDISLNSDQLKDEINFLKQTRCIKNAMSALSCHSDANINKKDKRKSDAGGQHSESIRLLMDWVNAVCAFYNKKVENFTVAFSDGRVLCYLIHHYHPCYVPFDAICQRTTQTVECTRTGSVALNSSSESDDSALDVSPKTLGHENASELFKELLENEKKNFHLVKSAVRDLGGIPAMIHHSDMSNTIPDEKVVITYLSFLCARLLDLRKEIRAARLIQATWRKHKLKADLKRYQERDKAARIIQCATISFLAKRRLKKRVNAALVIQKYWRRRIAQRKLLTLKKEKLEKVQNNSASVIQGYWRRYSTRKRFLKLKYYSVILQSRIRMLIAVTSYKRYLWAIVTIQRHWRSYLRRKQDQQRYEMLKSSAVIIQSVFRRWRQRRMKLKTRAVLTLQRAFREWHCRKQAKEKSAIVIQTWYRMHKELRRYIYIRSCIVVIQRRFRCFQAQKLYKRRKESILTIQKYYRAYLKGKIERSRFLQKRAAAIRLQAAFRGMRARDLCRRTRAACVLQSYWRMRQNRLQFLGFKKSVVRLQAHIRKHQQLQKYKKMKKAALVIQTYFRAYVTARKVLASYQTTRSAVIVLQSACRMTQARKTFVHIRTSVIKIQACYRAYISRKKFLKLKYATLKLQSVVKMKQAHKQYLHLKAATVFIQQWYRSQKMAAQEREEYVQMRASCIKLQAFVRGYLVRKRIRLQRKAAVSLQSYFRMRKKRQDYLNIYNATLVIQNYYRAYRAQVNQRKNYLQVKRAATYLQAAYRGYRVRQLLKQQSLAAVKIQTVFRGYSQRVKYQTMLLSAVKIQRWYRAYKTARDVRTHFLNTRAAVICLQSACRGWEVRKQVRREHKAAVVIQSAFRMNKAQKQFRLTKSAAFVIQQHVRAWIAGKKQRVWYIELRHAVEVLQSAWRGRTVRRQIQRQHECAGLIQSYYKMHLQHKKWKTMKKAALLIQMYYRAYSVGREQRHLYLKTKAAVLILQSAYRGMKVRKRIKDCNRAAVAIQTKYRAYKAKKIYATYRESAIIIQRWYRNIKIANCQHREYLNLKKTVIKLQAIYRGVRVRRHVKRMHMAATCIKAMFKMHQLAVRYHRLRRASVVIQVRYRAYYQGKIQRKKYLTVLKAVTVLQASFRGARVRQTVRKMQVAATLIQSYYRRYRQQKYFNKLKKVTKTVQQRYRAVKERNTQFQRYNKLRKSVICIQAAFRGMKTRRHLKIMHLSATLIQRRFRTLIIRRRFLSLKKTVVWIQRKYRAKLCAKHQLQFLQLQKAAIQIQSAYRGWVVRRQIQEMQRAAACIQAAFRMHRAYVEYQALRQASLVIQQQYHARRAAKLQRQRFLKQRHSATVLQAAFRGVKTRRHLKSMHSSATLIQSRFRSFMMRRRFIALRKATIFVQQKYRATTSAKQKFYEFLELRKAAIIIQSSYRRLQRKRLQERNRAATVIQATFRMHRTYIAFQTWKHASVLIQRRYRAYRVAKLERDSFVRRWDSAVVIQAAYKGMKARECLRKKHRAAVLIQSTYRMYRQHCLYQKLLWATKVIQQKYRANKKKQEALLHNTPKEAAVTSAQEEENCAHRKDSVTIQKAFHEMVTRKLEMQKCAALRIQSFLQMAVYRRRFLCQKRAAVTLQRYFRVWQMRRQFLMYRQAAVVLQNHHRALLSAKHQRQVYLQTRSSVIIIQARIKGFIQKRKFQRIKNSTRKIQAAWRMYKTKKYLCEVRAACKIQTWYRCCRARKEYLAVLKAVKIIQGYFYTRLERARFLNMKTSAIIIQRKWRARLSARIARENLMVKRHQAACVIQAHFRGYKERQAYLHQKPALIIRRYLQAREAEKCEKTKYIELEKSAVILQALVRGWLVRKRILEQRTTSRLLRFTAASYYHLAAIRIQRTYRAHLAVKIANKQVNAATCIQALWRGYSWRKKNDCTKIKAIRLSLQAVNKEIKENNKLYNRTALALHYLSTYKHLSAILEALKHLEVVTRLSPLCCENMAQSEAISKIFVLIRSCNRSIPCMEVIRYAVQVLLNVAKYEKTTSAVYNVENCIDTLLELLQMYREKPGDKVADKGGSIFTKTCCLLAVLLKTTDRASDVRSRPKVVDRIYSLYKLTDHKHKMDSKRILYKQKKNLSSGIPFIPETPVRTKIVSRLKPNWVLRRDNMEEITNPLQAIQMVMDTLGIPY